MSLTVSASFDQNSVVAGLLHCLSMRKVCLISGRRGRHRGVSRMTSCYADVFFDAPENNRYVSEFHKLHVFNIVLVPLNYLYFYFCSKWITSSKFASLNTSLYRFNYVQYGE